MRLLILFLFLFSSYEAIAQNQAVTITGDTVLLFDNGTWKSKKPKPQPSVNIVSTVEADVSVDQFDNKVTIRTEEWSRFGGNDINAVFDGRAIYVDGTYAFTFQVYRNIGCLSRHSSEIHVKLENDEVINMMQITDTDCDEFPTASFVACSREEYKRPDLQDILSENIHKLTMYPWTNIRIYGSEFYIDWVPKTTRKIDHPEQFFQQHILAIQSKL